MLHNKLVSSYCYWKKTTNYSFDKNMFLMLISGQFRLCKDMKFPAGLVPRRNRLNKVNHPPPQGAKYKKRTFICFLITDLEEKTQNK